MKTFNEYLNELQEPKGIEEGMDELSESRLGKAAVTAVAAKHRSSRMKGLGELRKAASALRKVQAKKTTEEKQDAFAEALASIINALSEMMNMSGANISVGVVSALTAEDAIKKTAKTRKR